MWRNRKTDEWIALLLEKMDMLYSKGTLAGICPPMKGCYSLEALRHAHDRFKNCRSCRPASNERQAGKDREYPEFAPD